MLRSAPRLADARRARRRRRADAGGGGAVDIMTQLFSVEGLDGAWFDFTDTSTLWQDTAGTTPATANLDPVARADDQSGNGHNLTQATTTLRYAVTVGAQNFIAGDTVDDTLSITVPAGGWAGTIVSGTLTGCVAVDYTYAAGAQAEFLLSIKAQSAITTDMVGFLIVNKVLSAAEIAAVNAFFVAKGAVEAITGNREDALSGKFGGASPTMIANSFTKLRSLDWSGATSVLRLFKYAAALTDIDGFISGPGGYELCRQAKVVASAQNLDLSRATDLRYAFQQVAISNLTGITWPTAAVGAVDMLRYVPEFAEWPAGSAGPLTNCTNMLGNVGGASSLLTTFPSGVFDDVATSCSFTGAFNGTKLDATGVNNILISLDAAALASVTIDIAGSNAAPTGAGLTAKTNLQGRGCTVNTN